MAENIPIYDGTLKTIHAFIKDALFFTLPPADPINLFHLNCFKEFCTSSAAECSVFSSGATHRRGPGYCPGSRKPRVVPVDECANVWPGCRPTRA